MRYVVQIPRYGFVECIKLCWTVRTISVALSASLTPLWFHLVFVSGGNRNHVFRGSEIYLKTIRPNTMIDLELSAIDSHHVFVNLHLGHSSTEFVRLQRKAPDFTGSYFRSRNFIRYGNLNRVRTAKISRIDLSLMNNLYSAYDDSYVQR